MMVGVCPVPSSQGRCVYQDTAASACSGVCRLMNLPYSPPVLPSPFKPRAVENEFAPDPKLIEHCEKLLADAQSGKLRAVGYAVVYHDGLVPSGEINRGFYNTPGTGFALGESISRLRLAWDRDQE